MGLWSRCVVISALLIILLIPLFFNQVHGYTPIYSGDGWEIDVVCEVYRVVDGDTFDCFPVGRIRLADANAPELSTIMGIVAKQDKTHLLNVNKWLVDNGYAIIVDHPNEFNPYTWKLHVYYPVELERQRIFTKNKTITMTIVVYFVSKRMY